MSSPASLEAGASLRLFFGLPLPGDVADALWEWSASVFVEARGARPVAASHLHVTLAFLGSRPAEELPALREALRASVDGEVPPVLAPTGYRETDRVAMIVLSDDAGRATAFQSRLVQRLERIGAYRPERRPWLPHVTVARFRRRPRLSPELPVLAPFSPSDAALYHSFLRPDGAQYSIVEAVSLGG